MFINRNSSEIPFLIYKNIKFKNIFIRIYIIKYRIKYISGIYSSYLQGIKQFEIYNNIKLSKKILNKVGVKI